MLEDGAVGSRRAARARGTGRGGRCPPGLGRGRSRHAGRPRLPARRAHPGPGRMRHPSQRAGGWKRSMRTRRRIIRMRLHAPDTAQPDPGRRILSPHRRSMPRVEKTMRTDIPRPHRRCSLPLAAATSSRDVAETQGPSPTLGAAAENRAPDGQCRRRRRLAGGQDADRRRRASRSMNSPAASHHPRWLLTLPNGDVLVAESDSPGTDKTGGDDQAARSRAC